MRWSVRFPGHPAGPLGTATAAESPGAGKVCPHEKQRRPPASPHLEQGDRLNVSKMLSIHLKKKKQQNFIIVICLDKHIFVKHDACIAKKNQQVLGRILNLNILLEVGC